MIKSISVFKETREAKCIYYPDRARTKEQMFNISIYMNSYDITYHACMDWYRVRSTEYTGMNY
jgi:hypothetical protein